MKNNIFYWLFTLLLSTISITSYAQQDAVFIYQNNGNFDAFLLEEIESMEYGESIIDGEQLQYIYTLDSIYTIPLSTIDSIAFHSLEPKFQIGVMRMNEMWIPWITDITENTISFKKDTPKQFLPAIGQVIIAETFEDPFSTGFSGRVGQSENFSDKITYHVDEVALNDIYKYLVCVGTSSSETSNARTRTTSSGQITIPYPEINISLDKVSISCKPLYELKYAICIQENENISDIINIQFRQRYDGSLGINCNLDASYNPEPKWHPSFIPINTGVPGVYGKIMYGIFFRSNGSASISANWPYHIEGVTGFTYQSKKAFKPINKWQATLEDPEFSMNLQGDISTGLAFRLQFGFLHEKIASVDATAYIGPKLSANFSLSSNGAIDKNIYSSLKDSELKLSLAADIIPRYQYVGSNAKDFGSISLGYDLNHWYLVPDFSDLVYTPKEEGNSGNLNGKILRNLLFPVNLGWAIYDKDDNLFDSEYLSPQYRKIEDWSWNGLEKAVNNIPYGVNYKAYPLIKLFGAEMRADKSVDIDAKYQLETLEASEITDKSAIVSGYIYGTGTGTVVQMGFDYSESPEFLSYVSVLSSNSSDGIFKSTIYGLKENTVYFYRAYCSVDGKKTYGEVKSFKTIEGIKVTTGSVLYVDESIAEVEGFTDLIDVGDNEYGFFYNSTGSNNMSYKTNSSDFSNGRFTGKLRFIDDNIIYYKAYIGKNGDYTTGEWKIVEKGKPNLTTGDPISVSEDVAEVSAMLNIDDIKDYEYGFKYNYTGANDDMNYIVEASDFNNGKFSAKIHFFDNNIIYYQAYLIRDGIFTYGEIKSVDKAQVAPTLSAQIDNIGTNRVQIKGDIGTIKSGVKEWGIEYSEIPFNEYYTSSSHTIRSRVLEYNRYFTIGIKGLKHNTTYYYRIFVSIEDGKGLQQVYNSETESFTTDNVEMETSGTGIDLGLSVLWADHNVGAPIPEYSGFLFPWAEVSEGQHLEFENQDMESNLYLTDIAGTDYDAAHVKWGGNWRMPTLDELNELYTKCSKKWVEKSGYHDGYKYSVKGMEFTGPNGNSIFMPATGIYADFPGNGWSYDRYNRAGYYWSSIKEFAGLSAWGYMLDSGYSTPKQIQYTENRLAIRPVSNY